MKKKKKTTKRALDPDTLDLLKKTIARLGTRKRTAHELGISAALLGNALNGHPMTELSCRRIEKGMDALHSKIPAPARPPARPVILDTVDRIERKLDLLLSVYGILAEEG